MNNIESKDDFTFVGWHCHNISFGNDCRNIEIGEGCHNIFFGNDCRDISICIDDGNGNVELAPYSKNIHFCNSVHEINLCSYTNGTVNNVVVKTGSYNSENVKIGSEHFNREIIVGKDYYGNTVALDCIGSLMQLGADNLIKIK